MTSQRYIVITRPLPESHMLEKQLEDLGYNVVLYPSISINKHILNKEIKKQIQNIASFDWIVFTSRNGIRFFMDALHELRIDISTLQSKHIAAVGPKTAEEVRKCNLSVSFIPSEFTTSDLAQQLPDINGKKVLLPRANIATSTLTEILEENGAQVVNIPIYETEYVKTSSDEFEALLEKDQILCITFTSPSTVAGFLENIEGIKEYAEVFSLPVLSIGPVTTNSLKHNGFQRIYTADVFTIEGMVSKLKESVL